MPARAFPLYWILNLVDRQLEVYTDPRPGGYRDRRILGPADQAVIVDRRG